MVSRVTQLPTPAWLSPDAPSGDVVLSSRVRYLRNIVGHKFTTTAYSIEMECILKECLHAANKSHLDLKVYTAASPVEREHFVACRLISHSFPIDKPGRALLLNEEGSLSVMVNEKDHLRSQCLTAGWSIADAAKQADSTIKRL